MVTFFLPDKCATHVGDVRRMRRSNQQKITGYPVRICSDCMSIAKWESLRASYS